MAIKIQINTLVNVPDTISLDELCNKVNPAVTLLLDLIEVNQNDNVEIVIDNFVKLNSQDCS